jgi:hypothetical protein
MLFFFEDNGNEGDPMPVLPAPGFALTLLPFEFGKVAFGFEAGFDLYMTNYAWSENLARPVPAAEENRSAFVIGPLAALQLQFRYMPIKKLGLRFYGGAAFDFRQAMLALDLNEADLDSAQDETDKIRAYFESDLRWFLPVIGLGADYEIIPRWAAGLDFRLWFPAYKATSGENLPAAEGWRFGISLRITRM